MLPDGLQTFVPFLWASLCTSPSDFCPWFSSPVPSRLKPSHPYKMDDQVWRWWFSHWVMSNSLDPQDCSPLSMGFPRREYWSGLPFPSPGDLPDPGLEPTSSALQAMLYGWATREAQPSLLLISLLPNNFLSLPWLMNRPTMQSVVFSGDGRTERSSQSPLVAAWLQQSLIPAVLTSTFLPSWSLGLSSSL